MFMRTSGLLFSLFAALMLAPPAYADQSTRVTWQPSSSGSCESCTLVGRQWPYRDLTNAHYNGANISHSSLYGAKAEGAHFSNSIGQHTDFSRANLSNAQFDKAQLNNASLIGVTANGTNFSGARLDYSDAREAIMVGANLTGASAIHLLARGADFSAANGSNAVFDKATLRSAIFDGALLTGASFIETDLSEASFRDARFAGANLARAVNYQNADFTGACRSATTQLPPGLSLPICTAPEPNATYSEAP